ncbi:hypothetical protein O6H91_06G147300 [Diphasiastrum complanatum]|uniref:Uncharacterized protein n=1 Tax=Diphasiastrum complanatum TaxID=34168 RepID=A0ACC2DKD9_DIPCM|nr:hypothetical protein O6H91_06G147300 [Diphasiastrum complanatum]
MNQRNNKAGLAGGHLPASRKRKLSDQEHSSLDRKNKHKHQKSHIKGNSKKLSPPLPGHFESPSGNGCPEVYKPELIQDLNKVSELDTSPTRNGIAIGSLQEKLLKRDKVWQYVCKRAVLVAPPPDYSSKNCEIRKELKFQGIAFENEVKTGRTSVRVYGREILVTVTCEAAVAQEWLGRQAGQLFGLDVEWKPNRGKGVYHKNALLQLSGEKECLMMQMLFMHSIPLALVGFLLDSEKRKAGVGVREDARKLLRDYGLACNGLVELTSLAVQRLGRPECKNMGLKALAKEVIGLQMQKLKRVTMSDWAKPILDRSQVLYCADAWVSFAVFQKLQLTY